MISSDLLQGTINAVSHTKRAVFRAAKITGRIDGQADLTMMIITGYLYAGCLRAKDALMMK
jgi:hypothetical protein